MSWCIFYQVLVCWSPSLVVCVLCNISHSNFVPEVPSVSIFAVKDEVVGDNISPWRPAPEIREPLDSP